MIERAESSDVSGTETRAVYSPASPSSLDVKGVDGAELSSWLISSFK